MGEVFAVFHTVGLAGNGGELEVHSVGGGLEGGNAGLARGVERVGAAGALSAVEGARSSAASGMPLAHLQPPLFPSSASAIGVERGGGRRWGVGGGCRLRFAGRQAPVAGAADHALVDFFAFTDHALDRIIPRRDTNGMNPMLIRQQLAGRGPFTVRTSDGRQFVVPHSEFILVGQHNVVIENEKGLLDIIDPGHVVSIRPGRRRKVQEEV